MYSAGVVDNEEGRLDIEPPFFIFTTKAYAALDTARGRRSSSRRLWEGGGMGA